MSNPQITAVGGCLCRAVRYEVHGPLRDIIACHCMQCRRTSGHFVAATATRPENLVITEDGGYVGIDHQNYISAGSVNSVVRVCFLSLSLAVGFRLQPVRLIVLLGSNW